MTTLPLFFVHIPKTGGTSLINLLRGFTPPGQAYTELDNNLSQDFTMQLAAANLRASALIHGHPRWGACIPFRGKARFLTLLRAPRHQIISHYLHALRDPAMPQHAATKALGFKAFLRAYPYNIAYQTNCLYLSITAAEDERRRAFADPAYGGAFYLERYFARQLAAVFSFFDEMLLAGTLEESGAFLTVLAALAGWNHLPDLPHDNRASNRDGAVGELLEQIQELETEPQLAPLFAVERAAYARAASLTQAAWPRIFRSNMQAGLAGCSTAAPMVHRSALGDIVLGENLEPANAQIAWWNDTARPQPTWWTKARQLSRLYVRREGGAPCRLVLHASQLHEVRPQEVALCRGTYWLPVTVDRNAAGACSFSTLLDMPAPDGDKYDEISLYLERNRYPQTPPFYPCLHLASFTLEPP